jgi:hypothetical protein
MEHALPPLARLEAREQGAHLHPVDRALILLRLAERVMPETSATEALPLLPLAERDRRLLIHRRATFGDRMPCLAECPSCGATQEFELSAAEILTGLDEPRPEEILETDGWLVRVRALRSADLAAAAREKTPERAAAVLVAQAIAEARGPDGETSNRLPDHVWPLIEARVAEREAAAEISLGLACPACGAGWTTGFDIGAHFWTEVEADARRLLSEVAALAERFGWSEEALLTMPASRRRAYLELARVT